MLTGRVVPRPRRPAGALAGALAALLVGLLVAAGPVLVPSAAAAAPQCTPPATATYDRETNTYSCTTVGDGGQDGGGAGGGSGGGGSAPEPTCELYGDYTFCDGERACWQSEGRVPYRPPAGPRPSDDAVWMIRQCDLGGPLVQGPPSYETFWAEPGEVRPPTLAEQAQSAIGQLDLAVPVVRTSPEGRTVVNVPTWFWVEGTSGEVTGSSAFGLVAIATARGMEVDPGDGSGAFACPFTTSAEQAEEDCAYAYPRASYDGRERYEGRPAHRVEVRAVWTLRFEVGGRAVEVPGAPTEIPGPASSAVVRVDEVQTLVRSTG